MKPSFIFHDPGDEGQLISARNCINRWKLYAQNARRGHQSIGIVSCLRSIDYYSHGAVDTLQPQGSICYLIFPLRRYLALWLSVSLPFCWTREAISESATVPATNNDRRSSTTQSHCPVSKSVCALIQRFVLWNDCRCLFDIHGASAPSKFSQSLFLQSLGVRFTPTSAPASSTHTC